MKKLVLTLAALAALSGVSLASQRGYDLRDTPTTTSTVVSESHALAAPANGAPVSNFDRLNATAQENLEVRH
jgi:hypothetical protein